VLVMIGLNALGASGEVSLPQAAFAILIKGAGFWFLSGWRCATCCRVC